MVLFGLLNLHKPAGITSRRVVDQVQRLVRPAKVGHAGTLDPLASGVLVIGIGQATRLVEYVQQMPKRYRATFLLGRSSTTEDVEGEVTMLPERVVPTREALEQAAKALTGEIQQRPPAFSALKVAGRRAYALARAGETPELASRPIQIHRLEILGYEYPELEVEVECSSGTYVRSLGRDLAELAGTAAVMSALVREAIGGFELEDAIDPETLTAENLAEHLLPAALAVRGQMDERTVTPEEEIRLKNGLAIEARLGDAAQWAAVDLKGRLVAILERRDEGTLAPIKYLPHP